MAITTRTTEFQRYFTDHNTLGKCELIDYNLLSFITLFTTLFVISMLIILLRILTHRTSSAERHRIRRHHVVRGNIRHGVNGAGARQLGQRHRVPDVLHRHVRGTGQCVAVSVYRAGERRRRLSDTVPDCAAGRWPADLLPRDDYGPIQQPGQC